jgi:hypothetical protein
MRARRSRLLILKTVGTDRGRISEAGKGRERARIQATIPSFWQPENSSCLMSAAGFAGLNK